MNDLEQKIKLEQEELIKISEVSPFE